MPASLLSFSETLENFEQKFCPACKSVEIPDFPETKLEFKNSTYTLKECAHCNLVYSDYR
jgi:hypothetical protein